MWKRGRWRESEGLRKREGNGRSEMKGEGWREREAVGGGNGKKQEEGR